MAPFSLPEIRIPDDMSRDGMPDLLRYWYLGQRARRYMMLRRFSEVDRELGLPSGAKVLDVGSAWGFNIMALHLLGYEAVGMDLVIDQFPWGVEIAEHNGLTFPAIGADASQLPFADESFDGITMVETLEHIFLEDRPRAMAECVRVLKPGGRAVFSTPHHGGALESVKRFTGNHRWIREKLPTMCYPEEGTTRGEYHPYRYHHPLPDAEIVGLLQDAGFSSCRTRHFLFMLKSTSDAAFGLLRGLESVAEALPGVRRLASTSCFVATK